MSGCNGLGTASRWGRRRERLWIGTARCSMYNERCRSKSGTAAVHRLAAQKPRRTLHRANEGGVTTVWHGWDDSVQHLGLWSEVFMDASARMFLCARCLVQVRLCSHCDRGQRYCTPDCSRLARKAAQREAARRYQRSRAGRMAHAARSQRWRLRHRRAQSAAAQAMQTVAGAGNAVDANIVTHQGSPDGPGDALLLAWTSDHAKQSLICKPGKGQTCRRCGAALSHWVRQDFLRSPAGVRASRRDHSP